MAVVTMKNLLESGVHFGHQTKRWDPRMKKYIFAERNGIHIIDLQKTIVAIKEAYDAVRQTVLSGNSVLFVGTKKQSHSAIVQEAERCGMFYVNNRWLGGMLTNFATIKKSLLRLKKLEKMEIDGTFESLTKKEVAKLLKERSKLDKNLGGIKEMKELPGIVFIIDTRKEAIAVAEAQRVGVPIVAVVDTNSNPEGIDYPIPGNDDAIRAITLFTQIISKAVIEADNEIGLEVIESLQDEEEKQSEEASEAAEEETEAEAEEENIVFDDLEKAPVGAQLEKPVLESEEEETKEETKEKEKEEEKDSEASDADDEDSFTAEDYSDYTVDSKEKNEPVEEEKSEEAQVAEDAGIDEDKLYEEE